MDAPIYPLAFHQQQLPALNNTTLVSQRIPFPFRVVEVGMFYEVGVESYLTYRWFWSTNSAAPTTAEPPDEPLFLSLGQQPRFRGEGAYQSVAVGVNVTAQNSCIKVFAANASVENAYDVNAVCSIMRLEGEDCSWQ